MWAYIVRRILLTIPIVLGVVLITMVLFSYVAADPARAFAGKYATEGVLDAVRAQMGLDKPRWFKWTIPVREVRIDGQSVSVSTPWAHELNKGDSVVVDGLDTPLNGTFKVDDVPGPKRFSYTVASLPATTQPASAPAPTSETPAASGDDEAAPAAAQPPTESPIEVSSASIATKSMWNRFKGGFDSQLFDILTFKIYSLKSMRYRRTIWDIIKEKGPASMAIQVPAFIIALGVQLAVSLYAASRRGRPIDYTITVLSVLLLAIPGLSVYLFSQWFFAMKMGWFPVAGWDSGSLSWMRFAALPVFVSVVLGVGGGVRLYRTVMIDEIYSDYVRTARAKGLAQRQVLFTHVLKNGLIPVITSTVTALPGLILGALLLERIFQIPGLGAFTVDALSNNDRTVVMGMTFALSIIYCLLLLASDVLYTLVNPQVSLR